MKLHTLLLLLLSGLAGAGHAASFEFRKAVSPGTFIVNTKLLTLGAAPTFSDTYVGDTSTPASVTISNSGQSPVIISAVELTVGGADYTLSHNCGTVSPGQQCAATLAFKPTEAGTRTGTLRVSSDAVSGPHEITFSGKGLAALPPNLTVSATSLDFGTVNNMQSADRTLTISNTGGSPAVLAMSNLTAPYSISANGCPASLPKNQSCVVTVRYTPQSATLSQQTLTVSAAGSPSRSVSLTGSGATKNYNIALTSGQNFSIPSGATNIDLSFVWNGPGSYSFSLYRDGAQVWSGGGSGGGGSSGLNESNGLRAGSTHTLYFSAPSYYISLSYTR